MDAISFVFGERTQSLRVRTVKVSVNYPGSGSEVFSPFNKSFLLSFPKDADRSTYHLCDSCRKVPS